jgi:hypothetical protein
MGDGALESDQTRRNGPIVVEAESIWRYRQRTLEQAG